MAEKRSKLNISKTNLFLTLLGFGFFINPTPLGFDVLPDFFGAICLFFGLTQLAFFNEDVEKSRKLTVYLLFLEGARMLTMNWVATSLSSTRLLFVTAFSIAEIFLFFGFFKRFFEGLTRLTMKQNCDVSLKKVDGVRFLSYFSFITRICATVIPELMAILELEKYVATDFETVDFLGSLISSKIVLVVLLSFISFAVSTAWIIGMIKLLLTFYKEAGSKLDGYYYINYLSHPEKIAAKRVKNGFYVFVIAMVFSLDISIDQTKILPFSFMFLIMFAGSFVFNRISNFKYTKILAVPAFFFLATTEVFKRFTVEYTPIKIYQTEPQVLAIGLVIGMVTILICLVCFLGFLTDLKQASIDLGCGKFDFKWIYISFSAMLGVWALGFIVPYLYLSLTIVRIAVTVIFIWKIGNLLFRIKDTFKELIELI